MTLPAADASFEGNPEDGVVVRPATEADVPGIQAIFEAVYGPTYPYQGFFNETWLKRSVYSDDIVMLVAAEPGGAPLGTASVVMDVGAWSDLVGEFGRLAVLPAARGRGVGRRLMEGRVEAVRDRLHVGVVENRAVHAYSQRISHANGFAPVGFQPLKHRFEARESIALYCTHYGNALALRCNHPRVVAAAHGLATLALERCGLRPDAVVDEDGGSYPREHDFVLTQLTAEGMPALMRIERGRLRRREVFGPMRLQYGFFKLNARKGTYLLAHQPTRNGAPGPVAGGVGYIRDDLERTVRVFELITRTDDAVHFLLSELLARAEGWGTEYLEIDVSAHAPRMQRTLVELGFLPIAYVPAMVFHEVERLDVVRFARLLVPPTLGPISLTDEAAEVRDEVMRHFNRQAVLPEVERAVGRLELFAGLRPEQAARVAAGCRVAEFAAGAPLLCAGTAADAVYLLMEGRVQVEVDAQVLGEAQAGELVGERAAMTGEPHRATVRAAGPVRAAVLSRDALDDLARRRPDIGLQLYRNLARGLAAKLGRADASLTPAPPSTRGG